MKITLVESRGLIAWVNPEAIAARTGEDGRFEIASVDGSKRWLILAWDPFRKGQFGAERIADFAGENVLHVLKQLRFIEPAEDSIVMGTRVRVRWSPLPDAASYTLEATEMPKYKGVVRTAKVPEMEIEVLPARYYQLSLKALDKDGAQIGQDCVPSCTSFSFGIADEKAEREMQPMQADCSISGKDPQLRAAPSATKQTEAPFLVTSGDEIKVRGKLGRWRKVIVVTGPNPGKEGWLPDDQIACAAP